MKTKIAIAAASLIAIPLCAQVNNGGYPITQVPFTSVSVEPGSFWGDRLQAARDVTIPLAFSKCETENRYSNFEKAAHPSPEYDVNSFMGFPFDDTDVYKTIEGASYVLATLKDKEHKAEYDRMKGYIDSVLVIVAAAQEPDGYLNTARTINPARAHSWCKDQRWVAEEGLSHELYNLGHMVEAACAYYQATGSTNFLDIAKKYADCVCREVGPGEGQACITPGHQIAEMALVRLYLITGEKKYLDEAKFLLDYRGKTKTKSAYSQSHQPVVDQKEATGHAVRAGYMYSGMADVAALTGDSSYIAAIDTIWGNIVSKKYYVTGSVGARHEGESFGANYELPNLTAYNETCAAISMVYLGQRMFLLHGDSKFIDFLERTLYNGVISGMSVDGGRFFYPNPLSCDNKYHFNSDNTIERQPWFGCACCPSNLSRFIPSVPGYIYAVKDRDLYVNLFAANTTTIDVNGKPVTLNVETLYPWDGDIAITVDKTKAKDFNLKVRIPGWVRNQVVPSDLYAYADGAKPGYDISVNGEKVDARIDSKGYVNIDRKWKKGDQVRVHFDMEPRVVVANDKVKSDRGRIAIERGPIVYCAEWADNPGLEIKDIILNKNADYALVDASIDIKHAPGHTFTLKALDTDAKVMDSELQPRQVKVRLIPYYAWNHRGAGPMQVWMVNNNDILTY